MHIHICILQKDTWKFLEVMDILNILIVVMLLWAYAFVQNHQDVHIQCVQYCISITPQ